MNTKQTSVILYGAALIAACSGKLVVDDGGNKVVADGGAGAGGAGGSSGGASNPDGGPSPNGGRAGSSVGGGGGSPVGGGGGVIGVGGDGGGVVGGAGGFGGGQGGFGGGDGGAPVGGSAGCFSGIDSMGGNGAGGIGTGGTGSANPTCPLDADGFATVNLDSVCTGVEWANSRYPCPASSADLTKGLNCDEVTTEHTGFTKTVGCGCETVEFHSYEFRGSYDLEHDYAASYDSSGALSGLVIKEPNQFGPCLSYAYKAGTLPPDCPSAVTYKCNRIPQKNASDAAYAGCRSPDETGCEQCCDSSFPDSCTVWTAANGSTIYENGLGQNHACTCGCKPCAKCKLEDERNFRLVVPHPECNCSLPPTGDCGNWCNNFLPYRNSTCPSL
jgi:hypothetical protein